MMLRLTGMRAVLILVAWTGPEPDFLPHEYTTIWGWSTHKVSVSWWSFSSFWRLLEVLAFGLAESMPLV